MKEKKYSWDIQVKGFGPFVSNTKISFGFNTSKVSVYASNGQGKTCISRMFRAGELGTEAVHDGLISRECSKGTFSFCVNTGEQQARNMQLVVEKAKGKDATVTNSTGLLFHVFNSDYVNDNLVKYHFSPSDNISGYIVGKTNIDVSSKKQQLQQIAQDGQNVRAILDKSVAAAREQIIGLGISKQLKEFSQITTDNVVNTNSEADRYEELVHQLSALKDIPEDVPRLEKPAFLHTQLEAEKLKRVLTHEYTHDEFEESFLAAVGRKRSFINEGMRIQEDDTCPFCGRIYDDAARALIHKYDEYLAGQEAKVVAWLDSEKENIANLKNEYANYLARYSQVKGKYENLKGAFSPIAQENLPDLPEMDKLDESIDNVLGVLANKTSDISIACKTDDIDNLQSMMMSIDEYIVSINKQIDMANSLLDKRSASLRTTKKNLCIEMCKKLRNEHESEISSLISYRTRYADLKAEIYSDESKAKRPKREAVSAHFKKLLHEVFGEKYSFDEDTFSVVFHNNALRDDAEQVLSDGEKYALAFCYYVATTLEVLENEDDASKLMFVIDDPISSLDYHYVYSVIQIIRDFDKDFQLTRVRFLILTHNTSFYNMLMHNAVTSEHYILHDGKISLCMGSGIVPYSEHLKDLYEVAKGALPKHTTGNSIRQIIETLWHFDEPEVTKLSDYIAKDRCKDLASCEYIYTLCQDESHGASIFDTTQPIDESSIRQACQTVLEHIQKHYPGQLVVSGIVYDSLALKDDAN